VRHKKKLIALGIIIGAPLLAHLVVDRVTHLEPPPIQPVALTMTETDGVRRAGAGWSVVRGVRLAHLAGTPEEIGAEHTTLLRDRMLANEAVVWDGFKDIVPFAPARVLLFDAGRFRYRSVESGFPEARRREVAAEAAAFTPDPFATHMGPRRRRTVTRSSRARSTSRRPTSSIATRRSSWCASRERSRSRAWRGRASSASSPA
jgi:isopenicillin-N N-acyltransferase-like protein